MTDPLDEVHAVFERLAATQVAPGIAYGIVMDGDLVHTGAIGTTRDGVAKRPDQDSVYRIASMTKSFTAAAVLLLRDEGRLRLDDHVTAWIPELSPTDRSRPGEPPFTIEHLLTMSAGLPTDDPWGDRQQGLDLGRFETFLEGGITAAWAPGRQFEYSNLGYGILGRVVTRAAGTEYRTFVEERLLKPLGMTATTYLLDEVPEERLAIGYVRRDDRWLEDPIDPYGALASMGGLFTSVRDLARWAAGFMDAFESGIGWRGHPLARATRLEMQQVRRSFDPELKWGSAEAIPVLLSGGYGYGLFVSDDLRLGRMVGHGGGYPGYGSYMRWHPASGLGVIALVNGRYVPMIHPTSEALAILVGRYPERIRRVTPWPETSRARAVVERLLERWDEASALALFAMNVELDEPIARRRAEIERLRDVHGTLRPDPEAETECDSPAHLAWWMVGDRGRLRVEILLDPERPPLVQSLTLTSVPAPPDALRRVAERVVQVLMTPCTTWPSDIALAKTADRPAIERALRATEALFTPTTLGGPIAGDGLLTATWRLVGERGQVDLSLGLDAPGGTLTTVTFVPRTMVAPIHAI